MCSLASWTLPLPCPPTAAAALLPILAELGVQVELVPARAQSADLALRGDAVAALKGHPPEDTALLLVSGDTGERQVGGLCTCVPLLGHIQGDCIPAGASAAVSM
jgi:hypothetical protein